MIIHAVDDKYNINVLFRAKPCASITNNPQILIKICKSTDFVVGCILFGVTSDILAYCLNPENEYDRNGDKDADMA